MKKISILLTLALFTFSAYAQTVTGGPWVQWLSEPAYDGVTGYAENPYDNPEVIIEQAPDEVSPGSIDNASSFDVAWSLLGDSMAVANLTSNGVAGDKFDLGSGTPTFGAAWKGVHDGSNLYVMLKYWDVNSQADAGSLSFEVMAQPTAHARHELSFTAASDSATSNVVAYQNMSYARVVELGGGKAFFSDGQVGSYDAGKGKKYNGGWGYWDANWGNNDHGLAALASATHFWDEADGVIRAILVMSFDGALGYPADLTDLDGDYLAVEVGDTIAFDIKSNALFGGTGNDNKVEYFWSADQNNGYASNYYSGHLILKAAPVEPGDYTVTGGPWVQWLSEPDYDGVTGYAENPYDNPEVTVKKAADGISPESIDNATSFDNTWSLLGDSMAVANLTSNGVAGDKFDLGSGTPTFGAAWKGVHDGSNLYVMLKYWDVNSQADAGSLSFEVMAQPTAHARHELSFTAASDSATSNVVAYQNMSYARVVELGGGKALFSDGQVGSYDAGKGKKYNGGWDYWDANWGSNEHGLTALASATHFWDETDGVIRAILVMSFDGALGYPADPYNLDGDYLTVEVGDTIAFDIKSNALFGGTDNDNKVEYFWSADRNNGYASNYYSGYIALSDKTIGPVGIEKRLFSNQRVYIHNDMLNIRGVESADVKVYSITGTLVKSVRNVHGQLDMSDVIDGIYVVKLEGVPSGIKVVKSR